MAVNAADLTLDELDAVYPRRQLTDTTKLDRLKRMAVNYTNETVGGDTIQGDPEDFALLVWAHYLGLREGDPQSESQTGGSVSYTTGDVDAQLAGTRWGREASAMIPDELSAEIVRGRSNFIR